MSLRFKALTAFLSVLLVSGIAMLIAFQNMHGTHRQVQIAMQADEAVLSVVQVQQFLTDASATHDRAGFEEAAGFAQRFERSMSRLKELDAAHRTELEAIHQMFGPFYALGKDMAEAYLTRGIDAGNLLMKGTPSTPGFDALSLEFADRLKHYQAGVIRDLDRAQSQAIWSMQIAMALAVMLAVGIAIAFSNYLTRSVNRLREAAALIAQGELDQTIDLRSRDELGAMARTFATMVAYLQELGSVASAISEGDLCHTPAPKSERDVLGVALSQMVTNLRSVTGQVRLATNAVNHSAADTSSAANSTSSAVGQMLVGIEQVSQNARALDHAVSDTSSSMQEVKASIAQIADNADTLSSAVTETSASIEEMTRNIARIASMVAQADESSRQAAASAHGGQEAVRRMLGGMDRIEQTMRGIVEVIAHLGASSEEIGAIVEVINDIADQTNLLALNAAIEAARAGEHGRGFAVVADEVRKLAERSGKATQEIAERIRDIQAETDRAVRSTSEGEQAIHEGLGLARTSGDALRAIVGSVDTASHLMGEIALASAEQAKAAEQIRGAVHHMTALTQQVAGATQEQSAGSEQILRAIDEMSRMAQDLTTVTQEQRLGSEQIAQSATVNQKTAVALDAQAQELLSLVRFFREGDEASTSLVVRELAVR